MRYSALYRVGRKIITLKGDYDSKKQARAAAKKQWPTAKNIRIFSFTVQGEGR